MPQNRHTIAPINELEMAKKTLAIRTLSDEEIYSFLRMQLRRTFSEYIFPGSSNEANWTEVVSAESFHFSEFHTSKRLFTYSYGVSHVQWLAAHKMEAFE
jgi:hypothetical protein